MKATGIVRKIDSLNRIVIPIETCRTLGIEKGVPVEIFTNGDEIVLRKYEPGCVFCGDIADLRERKGKHVCKVCADELGEAWL